jgi:DNA-binding IclR family transcriptional regulator
MSAVGLPIITASGRLVAAIAIGAINDRMTQERIETVLIPALRNEANRLSDRLSTLESKNLV